GGGRRLPGKRVQIEAECSCRLREVELDPVLPVQLAREQRRTQPDDVAVEDLVDRRRAEGGELELQAQLPLLPCEGAAALQRERLPREVDLRLHRDLLARLLR